MGISSEEINIEVAETCILLRLNSSELINQIRNDYRRFLSSQKPSLAIDISLTDKECVNEPSRAGLAISDTEITISDSYLESRIDSAIGRGFALLTSRADAFSIGLGTLLRNIFTFKLLFQQEAVALHAAGILRGGRVYIFVGRSGSGKTTVSELSKDYTVLSDDLVIIKRTDGSYSVFPTPFWLDMQTGERENRQYPIGGIFKLVKDNKTYLKKLEPAIAVAEIFTVPHVPPEFQPVQKLLGIFDKILQEFDLYELHFSKDKSFWSHVDELGR